MKHWSLAILSVILSSHERSPVPLPNSTKRQPGFGILGWQLTLYFLTSSIMAGFNLAIWPGLWSPLPTMMTKLSYPFLWQCWIASSTFSDASLTNKPCRSISLSGLPWFLTMIRIVSILSLWYSIDCITGINMISCLFIIFLHKVVMVMSLIG